MQTDKQAALRLVLLDLLGWPSGTIRPGGLTQPTEGEYFAVLKVVQSQAMGWGAISESNGIAVRQQLIRHEVTLDFFGQNAATECLRCVGLMGQPWAVDALDSLGLSVTGIDPARDLSALELDRWPRWQVRLTLDEGAVFIPGTPTNPGPSGTIPDLTTVELGLIAEP